MKQKVWQVTVKDNPNRVVMGENDEFYTTDTEAYLVFNLQDKDFSPPSAVLTLENRNDGSLKDETVDVVDGLIEWEMPQRYIEHFGNWQGQLVYYDPKEDVPEDAPEEDKFETYTSAPFTFVVNAHIGDKKKPSLVEIENWEKFIRDGTELIETWEDMEDLRQANEAQRQANYQELLDTGVLQTNINTKLEALEEEYAPKLTEVTAQLAQTETELRKKANQSSLEAEKSRIDNLINLPEGSTANDARLEDIKIGTDGTVYSSPGTAVRNQLNEKADYYSMEHMEDFELGYVDSSGNEIPSTTRARSIVYKLPAGSIVRLIGSNDYMLGMNTSASEKIPHFISMFYISKVYERVITKEQPFVRLFIARLDGGELDLSHALGEISSGIIHRAIYENDLDDVVREDRLAEKADFYKTERVEDFELGYVDVNGKEIDDTTKARSSVYKLPEGSIVRLSRPSNYLFGYHVSSRPDNISHGEGLFISGENFYESSPTTKERPYIRFFITSFDEKELDIDEALENGFIEIVRYRVAYEGDLLELSERLENIPSSAGISTDSNFNSTYRTPSRAEGGVVTFIDDDGKKGVYDILYPLFKRKNVPFGTAIVTDWIDTREDVMTLEQLKEIASDREIIEVMNHTKSHPILASTDEAFIHEQVGEAKKWFAKHGFDTTGLVLPYGESNKISQNIIQQYYNACYDFGNYFPESFDNIRNQLIVRDSWDYGAPDEDPLVNRKRLVDQAEAENKWLIITTHVGNSPTYWNETSESGLEELIDYIQSKGIKILSPKEGFQTFGNLIENDSGFKIQANGKIVGAK